MCATTPTSAAIAASARARISFSSRDARRARAASLPNHNDQALADELRLDDSEDSDRASPTSPPPPIAPRQKRKTHHDSVAAKQERDAAAAADGEEDSHPRRRRGAMDEAAVAALEAAGYAVVAELSDGSFGAVYRATRLRDGLHVAAKAVRRDRLSAEELMSVRAQSQTLATLRHRHLVALVEAFEHPQFIFHVFEFLHGGDLFDRLEARGRPFTEPQALELAAQMLRAVGYLHARRAAHRDIKLENFVFETLPTARAPVLKLIDFDLLLVRGRDIPPGATCTDMCGTVLYVPPELAAAREYVPEEADMWAVGVVLYVLLCFEMPFQGRAPRDILREVRVAQPSFAGPAWKRVSRRTRELVELLLSKSGAARPAAEEALARVEVIAAGAPAASRNVTMSLRNMSARLMVASRTRRARTRVRRMARGAAMEEELNDHPFLVQERASQDELDGLLCYDRFSQSGFSGAMYDREGLGAERLELQKSHEQIQSEDAMLALQKQRQIDQTQGYPMGRLLNSGSPHYAAKRGDGSGRRMWIGPLKRHSRFAMQRPPETGYC